MKTTFGRGPRFDYQQDPFSKTIHHLKGSSKLNHQTLSSQGNWDNLLNRTFQNDYNTRQIKGEFKESVRTMIPNANKEKIQFKQHKKKQGMILIQIKKIIKFKENLAKSIQKLNKKISEDQLNMKKYDQISQISSLFQNEYRQPQNDQSIFINKKQKFAFEKKVMNEYYSSIDNIGQNSLSKQTQYQQPKQNKNTMHQNSQELEKQLGLKKRPNTIRDPFQSSIVFI